MQQYQPNQNQSRGLVDKEEQGYRESGRKDI
jgi:hypothetical protein